MLESYLRERLKKRDILLMTHIVLGYPSFKDSFRIIENMVRAGVDLMELQIPFSEPVADGPVILSANQQALEGGMTVQGCFDLAEKVTRAFDIPFITVDTVSCFKYHHKSIPKTLFRVERFTVHGSPLKYHRWLLTIRKHVDRCMCY